MAYLKELAQPLCQMCRKPAQVELFNQRNAALAYYCRKCAKPALAKQTAFEEKS